MRPPERIVDALGRVPLRGELRFARMGGSSIAAPSAAGWITDFLNAAYWMRDPSIRDVDDLRLAFSVLATRWARGGGGRLVGRDLAAFHRAFGLRRLRGDAARRGTLSRAALLAGAQALIGDWFPDAYGDPSRRAYGIAFPTAGERRAFVPERRLADAALGAMTPPLRPAAERHWSSYEPVALPDPDGTLELLLAPERWTDAGADAGRFTALRSGGLEGNTFEIEVSAQAVPRLPVLTRGYVTCTALHVRRATGAAGLDDFVADVDRALGAHGLPGALPAGAMPLAAVRLTTHAGHFLGRAHSHLIAYADRGGAFLRDVGSWDPLPWYLAQAYDRAGRAAQLAFWGPQRPESSMLAQMAIVGARPRA